MTDALDRLKAAFADRYTIEREAGADHRTIQQRTTMKAIAIAVLAAQAVALTIGSTRTAGQTNPLWSEQKIKNYLPHMTRPEVEDLLTRTDMVIIPVGALEQHALHLPIGTDFVSGVERAKLIAQETDALVAPILMPGQSPYHMGFPGTITLRSETIQAVYFEAVQSLLLHGFKRFLILNAHGGNRATVAFLVDRINQETAGIAVDLATAAAPFMTASAQPTATVLDRHAGVSETSRLMYLAPDLVDLANAQTATLTMPDHLERVVPEVLAEDPTVSRVFLAEGFKAEETGKGTSAREISSTGAWSERDPRDASIEQGRVETMDFVDAAVRFINRWKALRPMDK
jgi:creatinine amidohydrolase